MSSEEDDEVVDFEYQEEDEGAVSDIGEVSEAVSAAAAKTEAALPSRAVELRRYRSYATTDRSELADKLQAVSDTLDSVFNH